MTKKSEKHLCIEYARIVLNSRFYIHWTSDFIRYEWVSAQL